MILKGGKMATTKKTVKKTVTKKPAAKKPAAKTTAAKKPAAKAPAAKKPAAKAAAKPAAKKTTAKPAAKVVATKAAAAKKPAAKTAAKPAAKAATAKAATAKAAATKVTAAKTTAKPAAKAATTKAAATKATTAKPAAKTTAVKPAAKISEAQPLNTQTDDLDPNVKYRDLFEAFKQGKLPFAQGYIVSSFFSATSAYSIYEIVSYAGVKEIFPSGDGLQFVTGGKKLHVLVQPDTYHFKPVEPVSRAEGERIPKRFNELDEIVTKNQSRIYVSKEPIETYGSFTILKPQGINFAVVFYQMDDVYESMEKFFEISLNQQRKIPQSDAKKVAAKIVEVLKKGMGFEGEYS